MYEKADYIIELDKYYKKLKKLLDRDADFAIASKRIVSKRKVDDILCCIDASYPKVYKQYVVKHVGNKLESRIYYNQLMRIVKRPFFFIKSYYFVDYNIASEFIDGIMRTIAGDIKKIIESSQS